MLIMKTFLRPPFEITIFYEIVSVIRTTTTVSIIDGDGLVM